MNQITRPHPESAAFLTLPAIATAEAVERMRRAIAEGYAGCRGGQACVHPTAATCECMEAATRAMRGLAALETQTLG